MVYFWTWSGQDRYRFYGRGQPRRNLSDVSESRTAVLRNAKFLDHDPSFNKICDGDLHQRSPNVPKFEDRSQEETEWQEQWFREAAWKLAKKILKKLYYIFHIYGKEVSSFHHSKLNKGFELEIVRTSRCSPTVITANGEVQTHEEATVYVRLGVHRTHVTEPMSTLEFFVSSRCSKAQRCFDL